MMLIEFVKVVTLTVSLVMEIKMMIVLVVQEKNIYKVPNVKNNVMPNSSKMSKPKNVSLVILNVLSVLEEEVSNVHLVKLDFI